MAGENRLRTTANTSDLYAWSDNSTSPFDDEEIVIDWASTLSRMAWTDLGSNGSPVQQTPTTQLHPSFPPHYDGSTTFGFPQTPISPTVEHYMDSSLTLQQCARAMTLPMYCSTDITGHTHHKDSKAASEGTKRTLQNRSA